MTPLHVAAEKGDRFDIVKYLSVKGADINITDDNGVSETTTDRTESALSIVQVYIYDMMMDRYSPMLTFKPMALTICASIAWQTYESQYFSFVLFLFFCLFTSASKV